MDLKRSLPIGRALLATAVAAIAALSLCGPAQAAEEFGIAPETFTTHLSTTQAGGHPDIRTTFQINLTSNQTPVGSAPKDFQITLPKGIVGAPTSVPTCPIAKAILFYEPCPRESMIGRTTVIVALAGFAFQFKEPVYSVNPYPGEPAAFAFNALFPVRIDTFVRADGDYGITVSGKNLTQAATLYASDLTLWGVPADHSGPGPETVGEGLSIGGPNPNAARIPFLSNPTECSGKPLVSRIDIQPWYDPTFNAFAEYTIGEITGCNQVGFSPTFEARPTTNLAGAPSGLDFALHMPQHNTITGSNEVQVVTVRASEGQFQVGAGGEFSPDLPFYATAGEVQAALENLKGIGAGNVSVAGGPGDGIGSNPYVLSYQGELGYSDVDQIEARSGTQPLRIAIANGTRPGLAETSTGVPGNPAGSTTEESATAHLRDAVVTLPEGMTLNPPASDGLGSCSLAEVGMTASGRPLGTPVTCPDQSKLGVVKVVTPVIENPLPGTLYLATQGENPFGSRFAIYLVVSDPVSGLLVKIPGQIEPDPSTGRVTFSFRNNPQLPIEDLSIELFAGPRAPLKTPDDCGRHVSEGLLTPWTSPAGADAELESSFRLTAGPDGGACRPEGARAPNAPTFSAGTISPTVKVFTPFFLKLTRADGTQQLKAVDTILPQGLLAKLAGVSICSDAAIAAAPARTGRAEQASPSCPANSLVGSVDVGVGAGSTPLHVPGKAYLTGPYKGAPASLSDRHPGGDRPLRPRQCRGQDRALHRLDDGPGPRRHRPDPDDRRRGPAQHPLDIPGTRPPRLHPQSDQLQPDVGARRDHLRLRSDRPLRVVIPGRRLPGPALQALAEAGAQGLGQTSKSPEPHRDPDGPAHRRQHRLRPGEAAEDGLPRPGPHRRSLLTRAVRGSRVPARAPSTARPAPRRRWSTTRSRGRSTCGPTPPTNCPTSSRSSRARRPSRSKSNWPAKPTRSRAPCGPASNSSPTSR